MVALFNSNSPHRDDAQKEKIYSATSCNISLAIRSNLSVVTNHLPSDLQKWISGHELSRFGRAQAGPGWALVGWAQGLTCSLGLDA